MSRDDVDVAAVNALSGDHLLYLLDEELVVHSEMVHVHLSAIFWLHALFVATINTTVDD